MANSSRFRSGFSMKIDLELKVTEALAEDVGKGLGAS